MAQAGGFYFHAGMSEVSSIKLVRETEIKPPVCVSISHFGFNSEYLEHLTDTDTHIRYMDHGLFLGCFYPALS